MTEAEDLLPEDPDYSPINEADYLKGELVLPFSTSLRSDLYLKMKRVEYWNRMNVREVLEEALTEYLNKQPASKKKLPAKERNKLKQLKTAKEYFNERISRKREDFPKQKGETKAFD